MDRPKHCTKVFSAATLVDVHGLPTNCVPLGATFCLRIKCTSRQRLDMPTIGLGIDNEMGQRILTVHTPRARVAIPYINGSCEIECRIPNLPLAPGDYWMKFALNANSSEVDVVERAFRFTVIDGDAFAEGRGFHSGLCVSNSQWSLLGEPAYNAIPRGAPCAGPALP
jgi:lipopolysaccharide transport system ATP-binding protein